MFKRFLAVVALTLSVAVPTLAAESPQAMIEQTSQQVLQSLRDNRAELDRDPSGVYALVEKQILPHFDFGTMSRWVLGRNWRSASPEQRDQFVEAFKVFLVNRYAGALLEYSNEQLRFPPAPTADGDDVTVRSEIVLKRGKPIPVNYSLHRNKQGEWKVYDVTIEGVSLVTNYRNSFADQIRAGGMDSLIAKLQERNAQSRL